MLPPPFYMRGAQGGHVKGSSGKRVEELLTPGLKSRGFSLIELLIVVAIILIIAAIAIPSLVRARIAANEAAAVAACKKIVTAQVVYASTFGIGYSQTLAQLGPPVPPGGPVTANNAALLDEIVTGGSKHGYRFTYNSTDTNGDGIVDAFQVTASPLNPGVTGERHFYIDQSGVIRARRGGVAGPGDPPIG